MDLNFFAKIKYFQSVLTEAFAKLSQVPLALFPTSDENPENENFLFISIRMTGRFLSLYHLYYALFKIKNA
jgi:hypothetical protein